jgi:hypothetical protein
MKKKAYVICYRTVFTLGLFIDRKLVKIYPPRKTLAEILELKRGLQNESKR